MHLSLLVLLSALGSLSYFARGYRVAYVAVWSTVLAAAGVFVGYEILAGTAAQSAWWHYDGFTGAFVILIALLQWTAMLTSRSYLAAELAHGDITEEHVARYWGLLPLFITSMLVAVSADSLGIVWIALEATTLATTLLVALYQRPGSLEAAWKYLVLCSTGIAIGLCGVLVAYYAGHAAGIENSDVLRFSVLLSAATLLSPALAKLAFVLILIGYGTKAGLVPMHMWLPDAHSSAPSPVSGLLSGVLLPVALIAVVRFKEVVDVTLGNDVWTSTLLILFGTVSVIISAAFVLSQGDYKRMLAYSSVEHIGIATVAFGLGTVGMFAGTLHLIGHALSKSALFFAAGNIVNRYHSTKFHSVHAVASVLPYTGSFFVILLLALLAVPPSPLFVSEYFIVLTLMRSHPFVGVALLAALTIIVAGFIRSLMPMLYGGKAQTVEHGERFGTSHAALLIHGVLIVALGVAAFIPGALDSINGVVPRI